MIEQLLQWQHPAERIWNYTPRQAYAWILLGRARHRRERAEQLSFNAVASQGDGKGISRAIERLNDGR
jgi:hypothetical protein